MLNDINQFLQALKDAVNGPSSSEESVSESLSDIEGDVEIVLTHEIGKFTIPKDKYDILVKAAEKQGMSIQDYMLSIITAYCDVYLKQDL